MRPKEIAIFARTESVLHDRAEPALDAAGIKGQLLNEDDPANEDRVSLGTMHRASGLEFKASARLLDVTLDFYHCARFLMDSWMSQIRVCSLSRSGISFMSL